MTHIRLPYWPLLFLALVGCRKDVEVFSPYAPSAQEIGSLLVQQIPAPNSHTSFTLSNLANDIVLETPNGVRVSLVDTDHLFVHAGTGEAVLCSTCPNLKVEVTEVSDISDIVARGLHTVTKEGTLFESGGMVLVSVTCNGEPLALLPGRNVKIQIPENNPQDGFSVLSQTAPATSEGRWEIGSQVVFKAEWPANNGNIRQGYELLMTQLGWAASGRVITEPSSRFCVELPTGFGGQNTLSYLVFKNKQVVAPLEFDLGQNKFCFSNVPIGFQVQLVSISKLGERFWLGKAETETGTNVTYPMNKQETTEEAIFDFLKSL